MSGFDFLQTLIQRILQIENKIFFLWSFFSLSFFTNEVKPVKNIILWDRKLLLVISSFIFSLKRWTGSDQNPQNNDGEGPRGQDRNNVVLLAAPKVAKDNPDYSEYGDLTGSYPEHLDDTTFLGLSRHDLINLAYARGNY